MFGLRLYLKLFLILAVIVIVYSFTGCGGNSGDDSAALSDIEQADREEIAAMLEEMAMRFKYRDKAVLYENELEFLRERFTFEKYLKNNTIRGAQADSVHSIKVIDITFFDRDSARVKDEIVLKGSGSETKIINNEYTVYHHQGRWTKPTIGFYSGQIKYEKEKADSGQ